MYSTHTRLVGYSNCPQQNSAFSIVNIMQNCSYKSGISNVLHYVQSPQINAKGCLSLGPRLQLCVCVCVKEKVYFSLYRRSTKSHSIHLEGWEFKWGLESVRLMEEKRARDTQPSAVFSCSLLPISPLLFKPRNKLSLPMAALQSRATHAQNQY